MASFTSKALPTAFPRGSSILVTRAIVFLPYEFPILTISLAKSMASSKFFINAPEPTFTSNIIASDSIASFLLIILPAIKDRFSTVAVTSLKA